MRLLAAKGLKATDYQTKVVVGTPARFDCLKSGECAAVPMGQPEDLEAIKHGFPRLGFTYEAGADLIFNVDMTRRAWGEQNKDAVVRFVRAMASAYEFMNDAKNRDELTTMIKESGKLSDEVARDIFAALSRSCEKRPAQAWRVASACIQSRAGADERGGRYPFAASRQRKNLSICNICGRPEFNERCREPR